MEFFIEYGLFLAKTITLIVGLLVLVGGLVSASQKMRRSERKGHIEVEKLNEHYDELKEIILSAVQTEEEHKLHAKELKKIEKEKKKSKKKKHLVEKEDSDKKKRVFVFDFYGDIKASEVIGLEQIVSAIVSVATPEDEVIACIESGGGMVHSYGLASSQLARFTHKKIPLTVCVDKVAASGGYMMACIGNKILSAPFALVGSIGVIAQVPNFNRLLKKHEIDYEQITAGEYKRTLTMFGENTDKGREKFKEEIQDTHELFKEFVQSHRPALNMADVATGEVWFGSRALDKGLVDEIKTAEEYLLELAASADLYKVSYAEKRTLQEKLGLAAQMGFSSLLDTMLQRDREARFIR